MGALKVWDGTTWQTAVGGAGATTWVGPDAPTGPAPKTGDLWFDTDEPSAFTLPLSIANGGTNAVTPTAARTNLGTSFAGGSSSTAGAPTTGTYIRGDTWLDSVSVLWTCTTGGTPGTWKALSPVSLGYQGNPGLTIPPTGAAISHDFNLTLPRAGSLFVTGVVRFYMNATSALGNVLTASPVTAPGGPTVTGYDQIFATGPYASAVQSGGSVPVTFHYTSAPAGACAMRINFISNGTNYGFIIYTIQLMATLV
jgi:hypothetical protein